MNYLSSEDAWQSASERKRAALQQFLLPYLNRVPADAILDVWLRGVEDQTAETVEAACARLLNNSTSRPFPAHLRAECRRVLGEQRDADRKRGMEEPPPGQRWLTPAECRERLEALQNHPVPEGRLQASIHRWCLAAYARGAER